MKLPLSWSPGAKKPHPRAPDRNHDRGEQTAQQNPSPAASLVWDRLLWGSSWSRMESQKPWELVSVCSHIHIRVLHPCLRVQLHSSWWGRKSLPPLQKWGVRRWHCSAGDPQEICGKAEEEFDLPLSPLCLLTPPSFLQAVSSLDNRQAHCDFIPLSCLPEL